MKQLKKTKGNRRFPKKEKSLTEPLVAGIIITAVLLSMAVSFLGYLENRESVEAAARRTVQTAARLQRAPETSRPGEEDPFENYVQLSDPLLVLVNERVPLPKDWTVTPRMIDDEQVDLRMYEALSEMARAAEKEKVWFWVASGYRSVAQQEVVLNRAVKENMDSGMGKEQAEKEALRTIARPGHSEHHTGLVVDLNDVSDNFEETQAYRWLSEHAADYGFVQRYERDKVEITGIDNESWHYRYVGKKNAKEMKRLDMCLEEYVIYLKKKGIR